MAALYLNFWLCVFSGVVATVQFLLIASILVGDLPLQPANALDLGRVALKGISGPVRLFKLA